MVFKPLRTVHIVIVGIIAHLNIGAGDYILDVNHLPDVFIGVNAVGVWPCHTVRPPFLLPLYRLYHIVIPVGCTAHQIGQRDVFKIFRDQLA